MINFVQVSKHFIILAFIQYSISLLSNFLNRYIHILLHKLIIPILQEFVIYMNIQVYI